MLLDPIWQLTRVSVPLSNHAQVADIPVDHPSASKQHAVLQFRQVIERNEFGDSKSLTKSVASFPMSLSSFVLADSLPNRNDRPFIIDLESANGTMVNDEAVPASRFYELRSGDGARSFPIITTFDCSLQSWR